MQGPGHALQLHLHAQVLAAGHGIRMRARYTVMRLLAYAPASGMHLHVPVRRWAALQGQDAALILLLDAPVNTTDALFPAASLNGTAVTTVPGRTGLTLRDANCVMGCCVQANVADVVARMMTHAHALNHGAVLSLRPRRNTY